MSISITGVWRRTNWRGVGGGHRNDGGAVSYIVAQIGEGSGFRELMLTYYGSTSIDTGNEALTALVQTRGMKGMLSVVFLISPLMSITMAVIGYKFFRRTEEEKTDLS